RLSGEVAPATRRGLGRRSSGARGPDLRAPGHDLQDEVRGVEREPERAREGRQLVERRVVAGEQLEEVLDQALLAEPLDHLMVLECYGRVGRNALEGGPGLAPRFGEAHGKETEAFVADEEGGDERYALVAVAPQDGRQLPGASRRGRVI